MMIAAGLALRIPLLVLLGQDRAPSSVSPEAYHVGPGDVLEVTVAGRPELSRLPTVQTTGVIWLPRLAEVKVEGLTPVEIENKLSELLARREARRSVVTVVIREYQSQFVWVRGEVNRPGREPLKGGMRLLDLLLEVGGFTDRASGEVVIERRQGTFPDGSTVRRFRFSRAGPGPGALGDLETVLERDDVVIASAGSYVTVTGAVVRPGRYALEGKTTLSAVVAAAGGVARLGHRRVSVSRRNTSNGQVQVLHADLDAIEKGREPDLELRPDDQIEIQGRFL
jgi:polysaccharide biosynthesis/export protein